MGEFFWAVPLLTMSAAILGLHRAHAMTGPILMIAGSHEPQRAFSVGAYLAGRVLAFGFMGLLVGQFSSVLLPYELPTMGFIAAASLAALLAIATLPWVFAPKSDSCIEWIRSTPLSLLQAARDGSGAAKCLLGCISPQLDGNLLFLWIILAGIAGSAVWSAATMVSLALASVIFPFLAATEIPQPAVAANTPPRPAGGVVPSSQA